MPIIDTKNLYALLEPVQLYADGTGGNDDNDGFTISTPKKTIKELERILYPFLLEANVTLNLAGVFETSLDNCFTLSKYITYPHTCLITGEDSYTLLFGPFTADISSLKTIGYSLAVWGVDTHRGKFVKCTSGPCNGEIRRVLSNNTTTIQVSREWSTDPGASTFIICEPATVIGTNTAATDLTWKIYPGGGGKVQIQRLTFNDFTCKLEIGSFSKFSKNYPESVVNLSGLVINKAQTRAVDVQQVCEFTTNGVLLDPTTWTSVSEDTFSAGLSLLGTYEVYAFGIASFIFENSDVQKLLVEFSLINNIGNCVRLSNVEFSSTTAYKENGDTFVSSDEYNDNYIEMSTGPGLLVNKGFSYARIVHNVNSPFVFRNNGTFGIEVKDNGYCCLWGAVPGTGNTLGGLYAHSKATVEIYTGVAPTLTGNGATVEISTDGTTEESSWASVTAGTKVSDTNQLVYVGETTD